jgi:hypothetical protein
MAAESYPAARGEVTQIQFEVVWGRVIASCISEFRISFVDIGISKLKNGVI